ncbi:MULTISPECIES: hypothetical protein [unclassified Microcoleus]|uniref:hypothetical protein n=1 Tax=unclassified Microcoleus TaxID=2642155 RepID=UPI002FCF39C8
MNDFQPNRLISPTPSPSTSFKLLVAHLAESGNHPIGLSLRVRAIEAYNLINTGDYL